MTALRSRDAIAARALEFLILTNVRTETALKAEWGEFDLNAGLWTIPLAKLKDGKGHPVKAAATDAEIKTLVEYALSAK